MCVLLSHTGIHKDMRRLQRDSRPTQCHGSSCWGISHRLPSMLKTYLTSTGNCRSFWHQLYILSSVFYSFAVLRLYILRLTGVLCLLYIFSYLSSVHVWRLMAVVSLYRLAAPLGVLLPRCSPGVRREEKGREGGRE